MGKMKMQLFGSFSLTYNGGILGEETMRSKKLTKLLIYILTNRDKVIAHQQLIEVIGEEESQNPEGVLKNLMYRMRKEMCVLGDEKFICTTMGAYRWNPEIEVESDYEVYEALLESLKKEKAGERRKQICRSIIDSYQTNVTSKVAHESWMLPKVTWYQFGYMEAIYALCQILEEEEDWKELELNCKNGLLIEPFDEDIHCWLLKSLHRQKKVDQAIVQYEKTKKSFYENMGISSLKKMNETFMGIMADTGEHISDVAGLLNEMKELDKQKGAFLCDYHIFRQIYRIEVRRMDRIGVAQYLMLLSLRIRKKEKKALENSQNEGMAALEEAVCTCLRSGDVVSRYSPLQFVAMLPMCTYESGMIVGERIQNYFNKLVKRKDMEVIWELTALNSEE